MALLTASDERPAVVVNFVLSRGRSRRAEPAAAVLRTSIPSFMKAFMVSTMMIPLLMAMPIGEPSPARRERGGDSEGLDAQRGADHLQRRGREDD